MCVNQGSESGAKGRASALVKKSLIELYENVMDLDEIKKFEAKEKKGKASFFTAEDILKK